jgi:antitoxin VapB
MVSVSKAKVFMIGSDQAVQIPNEYRFTTDEVYIRRDSKSGDLILSAGGWDTIFAALDNAELPEDFLADRNQGLPQVRESLVHENQDLRLSPGGTTEISPGRQSWVPELKSKSPAGTTEN